jgi:ubiquinone/menaquinone biosynthesis C-methylase UbiE
MARETSAANAAAVRALAVAPGERVLEIGFGHGRTIALLAGAAPGVVVDGIDVSPDMVRVASTRCAALVEASRARLQEGDSADLPYPDRSFDKVLSVHTLYFWDEPLRHMGELRRVLKPTGAFVLGFRERSDEALRSFPSPTYRFYSPDEVTSLLQNAGFAEVTIERSGPRAASVLLARAHP